MRKKKLNSRFESMLILASKPFVKGEKRSEAKRHDGYKGEKIRSTFFDFQKNLYKIDV